MQYMNLNLENHNKHAFNMDIMSAVNYTNPVACVTKFYFSFKITIIDVIHDFIKSYSQHIQ